MQVESLHWASPGQTRHIEPHAEPLLVVSMHEPLQHEPLVHGVPSDRFPESVHTDWPVAHDVVPAMQSLPAGLHAAPAMHSVHAPFAQT